jgi:hypothetical protein
MLMERGKQPGDFKLAGMAEGYKRWLGRSATTRDRFHTKKA